MTTPLQIMEEKLSAGQQPSYQDLEAALEQCLRERSSYQQVAQDMTTWLSSLVTARLCKDTATVTAVLDDFISKKVKVVHSSKGGLH